MEVRKLADGQIQKYITCQHCGKQKRLPKKANFVKYCSLKCRDRVYYLKRQEKHRDRARELHHKKHKDSRKFKEKCLLCGKYYDNMKTHHQLSHGGTDLIEMIYEIDN